MRTIPEVSPGDRIRASDLNRLIQFAGGPYANAIPQHGIAYANSQYLNASSDDRHSQMLLVQAMEDFSLQMTDHNTIDDVPAGKCRRIELNQQTNTYQLIGTEANDFWVHDPVAKFTGEDGPKFGEVFHVQWNPNSKRFEAAAGGIPKPVDGLAVSCIGNGWYEVELADFPFECGASGEQSCDDSGSGSSSSGSDGSASSDSALSEGYGCDLCNPTGDSGSSEESASDEDCESVTAFEIQKTRPIPREPQVIVCAHDARTLPIKIGGHVRLLPIHKNCDGEQLYAIISAEYEMIKVPLPDWACCDGEVIMVACNWMIIEGKYCTGWVTGCPSDSGTASA